MGTATDLEAVTRELLNTLLPGTAEVRMVARVEYAHAAVAAYAAVHAALGPERLLWHGTSWDSVPNIVRNGFNRAYSYGAMKHGARLGRGTYFAQDPNYALRFCSGGRSRTMPRALLLA